MKSETMIAISKMRQANGRAMLNASIAADLKDKLEGLAEETGLGVSKLVELAVYAFMVERGKL